jgi:DNA repair protein RecN (Recombination protein N)
METALAELGMPDARFEVRHQQLDSPGKDGSDAIAFYFNANKGGELMDLSAAASGGELSRLMLAVKSLISKKNLLPTMIFDEIDIGVSGKIADKVGNLLKELSGRAQVVAITHLPQIAGKGDAHYYVYKDSDNDITRTHIRLLEQEERVVEIAKLMSGEEVTDASMETARHLLNHVR